MTIILFFIGGFFFFWLMMLFLATLVGAWPVFLGLWVYLTYREYNKTRRIRLRERC